MNPYVITIAREYGSGGRMIGEMLASRLGIPYYDRDIIRLASEDSGIKEELFGRVDEYTSAKRPLFGTNGIYTGVLIPPQSREFTSDENLFTYQAKIIKELAQKGSCVIIGRCANFVLNREEFPDVLRVYIHASMAYRLLNAEQKMSGTPKELERFMRKDDRRKKEFCRRYVGKDWSDPDYYDLYLDTSVLGLEGCYAKIEQRYDILRGKTLNL